MYLHQTIEAASQQPLYLFTIPIMLYYSFLKNLIRQKLSACTIVALAPVR